MPTRYAIRTKHTTPLTRSAQLQLQTDGHSYDARYSYEDVPPIVAETDEENGVYALFAENGTKLSDWLLVKKPEAVEDALRMGRKKPGAQLIDSIGQQIKPGDYLYTPSHDHKTLELNQVIRSLRTKIVVEMLVGGYYWSGTSGMRTRTPNSFIKIPSALIEGGEVIPEQWEKRYIIHEVSDVNIVGAEHRSIFVPVDAATAMQNEQGHFGYFNSNGTPVTGWISIIPEKYDKEDLEKTVHAGKKVMKESPVPVTDAMGTDIKLGDIVFSNDNHTNDFMLCEVIGFTKERVRLVAYDCHTVSRKTRGYRRVTLNWPKNIIKLPITITTV